MLFVCFGIFVILFVVMVTLISATIGSSIGLVNSRKYRTVKFNYDSMTYKSIYNANYVNEEIPFWSPVKSVMSGEYTFYTTGPWRHDFRGIKTFELLKR